MDFYRPYFFPVSGILSLLLMLYGSSCFGQSYLFEKLTTREGLSQNTINCIYQDHHGFLWLGTQDGLNRYDGYEFAVYRNQPEDSGSLSHNWIWDIIEDGLGDLWVATWNGLNRLPATSNVFERYYTDSTGNGYRGNRPTSFSIDSSGFLWIGTWGDGLNRYDPEQKVFKNFHLKSADSLTASANQVRAILHDRQGKLWAGTWNSLFCLDPEPSENALENTFFPEEPGIFHDNRITSLLEDREGNIWIGTLEGGLNKYIPGIGKIISYRHAPGISTSISGNDVSCLMQDRQGDVWAGTFSNGLNRLRRGEDKFERITYHPGNALGIAGNDVYSIFEDLSGLIWVGANALNKYNPLRERFHHMNHGPGKPSGISHSNIGCVYETHAGEIWIGTEGGGINRFSMEKNTFEKIPFLNSHSSGIPDLAVGAITEDLSGNVWAGTRRNGLYILDRSKNVFMPFMPDASEGMKYINFLCPDTSGNLWIASFNNGLYKLNINRRTISNFRHEPGDPNSLPGNYLLRLHMDKQERLWIASWGGGLTAFEIKSGRFYRYLNVPGDTTTIADNIVYTVHTAKINDKEMLWVGTGAGMSYATLDSWPALKFSSLTVANGLPNNTVYCILDDSNGNLWISTNSGLSRYDPARNQFRNFYEEDGLQSTEFNGGVGYKISGGYLIFGGINGLNLFHPDSILENTYTPGIRINTVFVSNDVYKKDRNLFEGKIILSHQQNFLSFGFSALDFLQPEKIEYAYKLEGVDADWVYCQNRRLANYTNLKPGSYVFRARSTNSGKVWSGNETGLEITIIPPFWKTWWFRSLTGMIFLFLLFVAHRLRVRRILELERLRVRIASDLHDDFGSALTRIAIHSEQIRNTDARELIDSLSLRIGEISREVISSMSDIVWSIDARNDTMNDLVDRMQELNHNILTISGIEFDFRHYGMARDRIIPVDHRQNVYYIYKEAINNIVKHSGASSVDIMLDNRKLYFLMQIRDNGKGIDKTNRRQGNGLKNMHMRARRINAELSITSDEGTEITLRMKKL